MSSTTAWREKATYMDSVGICSVLGDDYTVVHTYIRTVHVLCGARICSQQSDVEA
jgi:hypothetical protein